MQPSEAYRFGPFFLDTGRVVLLHGDREIKLRPKAFETLLVLLRQHGQVISKDELVAAVWPDTIVNDDALAQCVRDVRKAIADTNQGYIRTLSRRGYMFVHPVVQAPGHTATTPRSVAVLPFEADRPADSYLAEGLAEATINGLVHFQRLRVAPRTSVLLYREALVSPQDSGRQLGVETVVTGKVSQRSEALKVQLDLVDVAQNSQIFGAVYEGSSSELLQIQSKILHDLSRVLEVAQSEQSTGPPARQVTANADAYRAYLQGRHSWSQRSEEGSRRAIECFKVAAEIDPQFAVAHSGLADCYVTMAKASFVPPAEAFPAARWHATKALELDATLSDACASLGFVNLYFDRDWIAAETEFQRAIALDSSYAVTHEWYSVFLLIAGRPKEAFREIQLACRLDPLSYAINCTLGVHHYFAEQYEEAVKQFRVVLEMNSQFQLGHLWLGRALQELGLAEEALAEYRWVEEKAPEWSVAIAARGVVLGITGRFEEARSSLAELQRLAGHRFITSYNVALVQAAIGDHDAAIASLNTAIDERSNWLVWLRLDPRWKRLRSDRRFEALLRRIRFP